MSDNKKNIEKTAEQGGQVDANVSQQLLRGMLSDAFKAGELWGTTYQGWFTPSEERKHEELRKSIDEIIERFKSVSG